MRPSAPFVGIFAALVGVGACSGSEFASGSRGRLDDGGLSAGGETSSGAGGGSSAGTSSASGGRGGHTSTGGSGTAGSGTAGRVGSGGSAAGGTSASGGIGGSGAVGSGGKTGSGGTASGGASATGGIGGGTGGSGTGGVPNVGDCALGSNSCGSNSRCVEVTPGGYRVCTTPYPEATSCTGSPGSGGCCKSSDCSNGAKCYPTPLAPQCGGIIAIGSNVCSADICTSDTSCGTGQICVPAGTLDRKVRMCVPAGCHHDTECTAAPGGICAPISGGCCSGAVGLSCVYPGGCRQNKDCASGNCQIGPKGAACSADPPVCPL
jgi:hypothetical protein